MVRHIFARPQLRSAPLRRSAALGLALLAASLANPAAAAKVYRCGNLYQDQPCPEVKIASAPVARATAADASCNATTIRDANGRSDCGTRTTRDTQRVVSAEAKR